MRKLGNWSIISFICLISIWVCIGCQKQTAEKPKEKTKLELWHYWDIPENQKHLEVLVEEFNESQDNIEIELSYIPDEDFKKKLALAMAEETMPDIALVDSSDFQFLHHMKPFAQLDEENPELKKYIDKALEQCMVDGKIYGQPFGVNCTGMFYNKKLLESAGCTVPKNWKEFHETAKKVSNETVSGFAITALQTEESMYEFLPLLWSVGGDTNQINSGLSKQAFELLSEMEKDGSLSRQSISLTMGDLTNQFIQGKIAMMFNSSMAISSIKNAAPDMEFGVAQIPGDKQFVSVAGGEILAVADNENKEAAFEFLRYLSEPQRMQMYIDDFGFLAPVQEIMEQQFQNESEKRAFIELYKNARVRELSTTWPKVSLSLADTLKQVLMEDGTLDQILERSAMRINEIEGGTDEK